MTVLRIGRARPIVLAAAPICAAALISTACNQAPAESATTSIPDDQTGGTRTVSSLLSANRGGTTAPLAATSQPASAVTQNDAATNLGGPPIEFEPRELKFGYVQPNRDITGEFAMRNVGDKPIRIITAKTSCACTTATDVTNTVIEPGEFITLEASIEGRFTSGQRRESIRYYFDGYAQHVVFQLHAEVTMPVRATPSIFNLAGEQKAGHVVVESVDHQPFSVLAANGAPPVYVDFDPDLDEPRSRYVLEWDFTDVPDSKIPGWWIIETDHPDCPVLDSWVRHLVNFDRNPNRPWHVRDRRFNLGGITPGSSYTIKARIDRMPPGDNIFAVKSLSPQFESTLEDVKRNAETVECTIRIDLNRGARGLIYGKIEFISTSTSMKADVIGMALE